MEKGATNNAAALLTGLQQGHTRALAKSISLVENNLPGAGWLLENLPPGQVPVIGITGAPGAGKSTLTDALVGEMVQQGKRVVVLCVDPSSAFNMGALLGDRIRMSSWYLHPDVFIRSLASRGAMGGLHPNMIEVTDVARSAGYDFVIVETVGVGQSEIDIAGLADVSVVVLVPEGGDEVQTMKAGLMEIADIFVVNKADRPGAGAFIKNMRQMLAPAFAKKQVEIPVLQTVATTRQGVPELFEKLMEVNTAAPTQKKRAQLLLDKAYKLIAAQRMQDVSSTALSAALHAAVQEGSFNLYQFVKRYHHAGKMQ